MAPPSQDPAPRPPGRQELIPVPERIEGDRVVVRGFVASDANEFFEAVEESRARLRRFLPWAGAGHASVDETAAWLATAIARTIVRDEVFYAVRRRADDRFLGGIGFHPYGGTKIAWDVPAVMIGYWIRTSEEGKGYVAEAVRALTRVAFDVLHVARIDIRCDARNERSARVMERTGFVREGVLRNDGRDPSGGLRDTLVSSMTPADYAARASARPNDADSSPVP